MNKKITNFYDQNPSLEWDRLSQPYQCVEYESTFFLIDKYFPKNGRIIDLGCGPGRYSIELLKRKYQVTLLDLSNQLLKLAETKLKEARLVPEQILCQDARDLSNFPNASFDAVLACGPIYHIIQREDRLHTLREIKRILKPGGIAIISYINTWGVLKCGINDFPEKFRDYNYLEYMLEEKVYDNAEGGGFTESYWSTPPLALKEVDNAGFEILSYAGAESFISGIEPIVMNLAQTQPEAHQNLLRFAAQTCELPQYRDSTEHLLIVVRK
jgi:ubiquinone/menaquinone biosynthesis C-methylase UbiE